MPTYPRKGRPLTVSLDPDAWTLLRALCPNNKGLGLLVSELIRKEALDRAGRPALLDLLTRRETERVRLQQVLTQALAEATTTNPPAPES